MLFDLLSFKIEMTLVTSFDALENGVPCVACACFGHDK